MEFNPFLLFKANEIVIFLPKLLFVIDFVRGLKQIALILQFVAKFAIDVFWETIFFL